MAFQARHRWVIQKLDEGLGINNEGLIEEGLRDESVLQQLNEFFRAGGPSKIIFFYQPPQEINEHGEMIPTDQEPRLYLSDGNGEPLRGRAVYFMRNARTAGPEVDLDPSRAGDGLVSFGTIDETALTTLESSLHTMYTPLLHARGQWGKSNADHAQEFLNGLDRFVLNLQEALKSLLSGLELRKPDKRFEIETRNFARTATDPDLLLHFVELLSEWCKQTELYLDDSDQSRWESNDAGPDTELEYWRRRMQRLTNITEQLKTKECKAVIGVLSAVTKAQSEPPRGVSRQQIFRLLRRWRQIDINITEAANEAKDNVKYLATLEKFIEPLFLADPAGIIDTLPALLNSIKMIHTIARYYNTTERMTGLFMKITNQMISNCKHCINGTDPPEKLWDKPPQALLIHLESCLRLNEAYQESYRITKDKLLTMPKGKQFDFSETQIFGKFDLFCRRIIKLIDMFSTIHQFRSLADHNLEGMEGLIASFFRIIDEFKRKRHDLLDYHNNKFDRDYVEFNVRISDLENSLQQFINQSFESITSIEQSLGLLRKFQSILQRENLKSDLDSKFTVIFHNYGLDLTTVQEIYEKYKHSPPLPRNMPPVAGNIMWSRHLLQRIEEPMTKFEANHTVLASKDSRKIVKTYNKVARTLVAFEYLWYEAWCRSIDNAKAGLQATLIIRHPSNGKLYVNFDPEILQLIREAKCLSRMEVEVPEGARMVLLQEERFKTYHQELSYALSEYDRVMGQVLPVTQELLRPHVSDLEHKLRPGMVTLTWTSMNIDAYLHSIHSGLQRLEELVHNINDIMENRVEKNLKTVSKTLLVDLPADQSFALDEFVLTQERHVRSKTEVIQAKNVEVETAVQDLIRLVLAYPLDAAIAPVSNRDIRRVQRHYNSLMYQALLNCSKNSLNALKTRVCSRGGGTGFLFVERPFFEVDVQLAVPSVRLSPSLDDIQRAVNKGALAVLRVSKSIWDWDQDAVPLEQRVPFFAKIGKDVQIVKVCLLLTGAMHGTRNQVHDYLHAFRRYDWLWKEDMELAYRRFIERQPEIGDFETELKKFVAVEAEIEGIASLHNIGALSLNTRNLKLQLRNECRQWKVQYSDKVHGKARGSMVELLEYVRTTHTRLAREVDSLDALRFVMTVLREVRERESSIEMVISPILDMYSMLESYLPGGYMDTTEMDQKSVIRSSWRKLVDYAEEVTDKLSSIQGKFKRQLMRDVREFTADVEAFRHNYVANGPMVKGLTPTEAVERLRRFKDEYEIRERNQEAYSAGEELFALRRTEYPELVKTRKELGLLDQLYGLYMDVVGTMEELRGIAWADVVERMGEMTDTIGAFDARCRAMPRVLRDWDAYHDLRREITDFQEVLPLLQELSKESICNRHWAAIMEITGATFTVDREARSFKLTTLLDANLLEWKEDIEEICDGADKQLSIETKLNDIKSLWGTESFVFGLVERTKVPVLKGFGQVIEDLEDSQLSLQTMLSMRHVAPFKDDVAAKLAQLSDTADTLELWVKVQMLWMSLESVFTHSGDIAKQLPLEAKKFAKVNKDWTKIMVKASETENVVACCANELLRNTLPILYTELEKCQKSLEGYLEQKRGKFPRFYFVSNPVLLQILSQGSDPQAVQLYYEKIFDSIDRVVHDSRNVKRIKAIMSIRGKDSESIPLAREVAAEGSIEEWLCDLESEMQRTMKDVCCRVSSDCGVLPLREMVDKYCGQFALLGIQFTWTMDAQEALAKCRTTKSVMSDCNKKQLMVLSELSSWCLQDLGTAMNRTKIETLVTIQVHQRDVFAELARLYKERKLSDASDFEWLKQARFYWRPDGQDKHGSGCCTISICDVDSTYSYEYLGCKERLVITALTDRAYITLSQALGMHLGGAPAGPAGTGKTETVKDLGRALGICVMVTNCTDQQRYTDMAKIFKGLCQAGLWGCFDEFNRIELPVLSVVAQQVLAITNAKRVGAPTFTFPGDTQTVGLNPAVGYFITMNPGYQGRQELPENLKVLFRGVAMMVPDREMIMRVKLCSVGFGNFTELAKKFRTLYRLCEEQLSKQKHYDFGLRNILSVLRTAGTTKRENVDRDEAMLLMRTLRDMNLSKLVAEDTPLFLSLLRDLFPGVAIPAGSEHGSVLARMQEVVARHSLVAHDTWMLKVLQLYETSLVRHGIMLVGPTGAGKSRIMSTLQDALTLHTGIAHKVVRMNPKAIRAEEMFGETDKLSGEWLDGVFAAIWAKFNDRSRKDNQWIACDGPVDAIWIENLNTVLDDNKILTLANGDRIPMTDNVKLMFEVENLNNASPATVSRAGIIYVSATDLDWFPVVDAWLATRPEQQESVLRALFMKFVGEVGNGDIGEAFRYLSRECKQVTQCTRVGMAVGCYNLLHSLLEEAELSDSPSDLEAELGRLFLYAVAWSVGGLLEPEDRIRFNYWLKQRATDMPPCQTGETVYEYYVHPETLEWERWAPPQWEYPFSNARGDSETLDFSALLVPTMDSTRSTALLRHLHRQSLPVLMVGGSGTAKTSTALMYFDTFDPERMFLKKINFSSATSAGMFQRTLEASLEKRGGKTFGPPSNKKMTLFLDDLSMPEVNEWGDQPTLELARQLLEDSTMCFLEKDKRGDLKVLEDLQFVACSNYKRDIPQRLKRHFFVFNMILPATTSIDDIYGQMLRGRVDKLFKKNVREVSEKLTGVTIKLWAWVKRVFLPTPAKFHYVFNMRELSRVFQGVLRSPHTVIKSDRVLLQLWRHECERVFADKLTSLEDQARFRKHMDELTDQVFGRNMAGTLSRMGELVNFVSFLRDDEYDEDGILVKVAPRVYEPGGTIADVRPRVQAFLDSLNGDRSSGFGAMHLVLFDDAMRHLLRISRILCMPRGNALLVGVGGSGKQSMTRLAAYICSQDCFQISLTKTYGVSALLDDLRQLFKTAGQLGQGVTFIFTDAEIKDESFLEYINSMLMTGEVPNLFPKDELNLMCAELRQFAQKERPGFVDTPESLYKYFIDRVRNNLHVVLCMSPVNAKFAERARKFPGLINGCTIDWFLPWPEEALVSVSRGYIGDFALECVPQVKEQVIAHMGTVHSLAVSVCSDYFAKLRRHVHQTPKSFLSFLQSYKDMYARKLAEIKEKEERVNLGLRKLIKGAEDVEAMKIELREQEVELRASDAACSAMLGNLEISSLEAKKENDGVQQIKENCEAEAAKIATEKGNAEEDLAKAQPYLDEADRAVNSIKPGDLNELKKLPKPADIIKLVFDCVLILRMEPLVRVESAPITLGIGKAKETFDFLAVSYKIAKQGILADAGFLKSLFYFSQYEKDNINEETMELLMPYLELESFLPSVARNASRASEGLCTWVKAMCMYHHASKVVKPKLEALKLAEAKLEAAEKELRSAEAKSQRCKDVLDRLQGDFEQQMSQKSSIEASAVATRRRMEQATALIDGLSMERQRWTEDANTFADTKNRLVGDCALACGFISYCGAFNQDFRMLAVRERFLADLQDRGVPVTQSLDLIEFVVDVGIVGDWNLQGLPTDKLSIENGILVTFCSRYPLLIDPQGQGLHWIKNREAERLPLFGTTELGNPKLKEQVEFCLTEGKSLIITGLEGEVDPMLTPMMDKRVRVRGKTKYVSVADKMVEFHEDFRLFMTTRLPNPHFSPELQARTTLVDFAVTQKGLEEQLLGSVIQKEQRALEEQLNAVLEAVTMNRKALLQLDAALLERLTSNDGNLLDDEDLISVLADTKAKAMEVNAKLVQAEETKTSIAEQRELYRPVATRGSVLYFSIVDMSLVNVMYQTSLDQFLLLFNSSMDDAERAGLASKRVNNIIRTMTERVFRYISRGLYEPDKLSFALILTFKMLATARQLAPSDVTLFLKGGASLDINAVRQKPFAWLSDPAWLNVVQLSAELKFFKVLPDEMTRNEGLFRRWYESNEPEKLPIPDYEPRFGEQSHCSPLFLKLLLVRSLRPDRTILAVTDFIRGVESVEQFSAMGPQFVEPVTDTIDTLYRESRHDTPVVYLLSAGADPTEAIEQLARRKKTQLACVSMGEGQEPVATKAITAAAVGGSWVLLQNGHLGLGFMEGLDDTVSRLADGCNPNFRLFISTEPHPRFPISLLQRSTKVTNEPPAGLRASMMHSYTVMVDQEKLERVDTPEWRQLLYMLCFLHSVVQERRKFGPLGWNIPYEFNNSDLTASSVFLEKHLYSGAISWPTLQYMVSEVQYGGKITDDMDRRLFNTYADAWMGPSTLAPNFTFNPSQPVARIPDDFVYSIPDGLEIDIFRSFVQSFPEVDSPEVFGLHPNADMTFRVKEATSLLGTILETQPKESEGGAGHTREEAVREKAEELLAKLPTDYSADDYRHRIEKMGGLDIPLNIFLFQEIQRLQRVLTLVRDTLHTLCQAIRGEVAMTPRLLNALNATFDARVPGSWLRDGAGDEVSWLSPNLGLWFTGLQDRDTQIRGWLLRGRPYSFWLTGFFNPQGFLTAMRQEVTRHHKVDRWALDDVVFHTEVTDHERADTLRADPKEGVYVHGLFLDGAAWKVTEKTLVESAPKKLFCPLPVLLVTAITRGQKKNKGGELGPYGGYDCPCYKYPSRTDRYLIFTVTMPSRDHRPNHWTIRGVALLCSTEG